jgi:hypothetical protein
MKAVAADIRQTKRSRRFWDDISVTILTVPHLLRQMPEYLWPLLVIAGYIILMKWVLPKAGVPT